MPKKPITIEMLKASLSRNRKARATQAPVKLALAALQFHFGRDKLQQQEQIFLDKADTTLLKRINTSLDSFPEQLLYKEEEELEHGIVYFLSDYDRTAIFGALGSDLTLVLETFASPPGNVVEELLFQAIRGVDFNLPTLSIDELAALRRVGEWLSSTSISLPDRAEIHSHIQAKELLAPFELITKNFKGRTEELAQIKEYVDWMPKRSFYWYWKYGKQIIKNRVNQWLLFIFNIIRTIFPAFLTEWLMNFLSKISHSKKAPLLIHGIGGIGKSTLLAKFILDNSDFAIQNKIPFVYLDFDRPGLSLSEPLLLASEGLRQLSIQFPDPELSGVFQDVRSDIRTFLSKNRTNRRGQKTRGGSVSNERSRANLIESIKSQYIYKYSEQLIVQSIPILIVMDSFEEAQFRATPSELNNLFNFIEEIGENIPRLRLIIAGRDDLLSLDDTLKLERLKIGEFDKAAAEGYLEAKGLKDASLRASIVEKLGGNPLSLSLAANHVLQVQRDAKGKKIDLEKLFDGIDRTRIQEQLVRRNLKHIKGKDAQKLAFPGLLVRRISPEIIQEVLAEPCGLGTITLGKAKEIFENLKQEHFLINTEKDRTVFRRDLRITLYDLIAKEYGDKVNEIHSAAIDFYGDKESAADRAECLYHRLKRGDDTGVIDEFYQEDMRPFLESALLELPENAYVHLAGKLGIIVDKTKIETVEIREWEEYMATQIINSIEYDGDDTGLKRLKNVLEEREERSGNNEFAIQEAKLYIRLRDKKAEHLLGNALMDINMLQWRILKGSSLEYWLLFSQAHEIYSQLLYLDGRNIRTEWVIELIIARHRTTSRLGKKVKTKLEESLVLDWYSIILRESKKIESENDQSFWGNMKDEMALAQARIEASNYLFPKPYRSIISTLFQRAKGDFPEEKFTNLFKLLFQNFLSKDQFLDLFNAYRSQSSEGVRGLERRLYNHFDLQINQISYAGTFEINLFDTLLFLEQHFSGNYTAIAEFLGLISMNKDIMIETGNTRAVEEESNKIQKRDIERLLREGKTKEAIDALSNMKIKDESIKEQIMLMSGRFLRNQTEFEQGLKTSSDQNTTNARLVNTILDLLDRMPDF